MKASLFNHALSFSCQRWHGLRRLSVGVFYSQKLDFVPEFHTSKQELSYITSRLDEFIAENPKIFVITGAGISTESGIRDYRSEGKGLYAITNDRPMEYQVFLKSAVMRQRYWARNYVGWPEFGSRQPNEAHYALAKLETLGSVHSLVTQNVDALHTKAGSKNVIELHGCSHRVICLGCNQITARTALQKRMIEFNPDWHAVGQGQAPDGDTFLTSEAVKDFKVPPCKACGGILKPEVVFFGDSVPKQIVNIAYDRLAESDALWIIGSTVEVYSSYRFATEASKQGKPIAILNIGKTRADKLASLKVSGVCGTVLPKLDLLQRL
ncbi:predicted protein [Nematostella vectensis]|uniref:Deacetylase sirtuin-type domain-containing protein n=1 Tax=Nematostella vectensis TaxID=45351 RepID=A7SK95_NEMVE|nr:predicted protein [Nematostella vectensis]|eukprot:XP_001627929.1 predicted protein [Nematostella vectensis]